MATETYFKTYSEAIAAAIKAMEGRGYVVNPDESFTQIGVLSKRPKNGQTTSVNVPLYKKGDTGFEKVVGHLAIQVYNRGDTAKTPFELNFYNTRGR